MAKIMGGIMRLSGNIKAYQRYGIGDGVGQGIDGVGHEGAALAPQPYRQFKNHQQQIAYQANRYNPTSITRPYL